MNNTNRAEFEKLLGEYWAIAFSEGKTGVSRGDDASLVLHKIRAARAQSERVALSDEQIRSILMAHGFKIHEGMTDLKPYVYESVRAVLAAQADHSEDDLNMVAVTQPLIAEATRDDVDSCALDAATKIMAFAYGPMPIGGSCQLKAKIQCAVRAAIASVKRDDVAGDAS